MKSTHTPGPWRIGGGPMRDAHERHVVRGAGLEYVARIDFGNEARAANARLIAAAPELLAVVRESREMLRRRFPDDSLASGNWPDIKPIAERWDALLASIDGGDK